MWAIIFDPFRFPLGWFTGWGLLRVAAGTGGPFSPHAPVPPRFTLPAPGPPPPEGAGVSFPCPCTTTDYNRLGFAEGFLGPPSERKPLIFWAFRWYYASENRMITFS